MIEAKQLRKSYVVNKDHEIDVLKNIHMSIRKGEFISVMGPSGSGKSTLLYVLSGMDRMTAGHVIFKGKEIGDLAEKELSQLRLNQMGFIFQHNQLLSNLSILDNIILPAYAAKKMSRQQANGRATQFMENLGIEELAGNDITQASGGQLQRVAICRALMNDPEILFADEPTGALNSKSAEEVLAILTDINTSGTTILLDTHDIKVAAKTERVLYMLDGEIVGEKQLGQIDVKNPGRDLSVREEMLSRWLIHQGF